MKKISTALGIIALVIVAILLMIAPALLPKEACVDEQCTYNPTAPGPTVYLLGNSVASQYEPGLIYATRHLSRPLVTDTTRGGCFVDTDECDTDVFAKAIARLVEQPPGTVIFSSTWDLGLLHYEGSTEELVTGLTEAVLKLQAAGHRVILVGPTPRFFWNGPNTIMPLPVISDPSDWEAAHSTAWRPEDGPVQIPVYLVNEAQATAVDALWTVAKRTGATLLDPREQLCWDNLCPVYDKKFLMYRDGIHISEEQSQGMSAFWIDALINYK